MLSGIMSIGNIGMNVAYVYFFTILLGGLAVYYVMKRLYWWAIKKQMLRFLSYLSASMVIISLTIMLAMIQDRNVWNLLRAAMQGLAFLGMGLAIFPLLHQFILKRK